MKFILQYSFFFCTFFGWYWKYWVCDFNSSLIYGIFNSTQSEIYFFFVHWNSQQSANIVFNCTRLLIEFREIQTKQFFLIFFTKLIHRKFICGHPTHCFHTYVYICNKIEWFDLCTRKYNYVKLWKRIGRYIIFCIFFLHLFMDLNDNSRKTVYFLNGNYFHHFWEVTSLIFSSLWKPTLLDVFMNPSEVYEPGVF
jgi:hypothetical protein